MNRSDVVLVHIPFVGAPGGKVRPALVVRNNGLNGLLRETIIAEITSNLANAGRPDQVLIEIASPTGIGSGLLADSDPIVDEVRRARDAYAARFNYDLRAIFRDLKKQEKRTGRKLASYVEPPHQVARRT
jgi:mRNA-degrading endonuclease toxin of MazEF toxin-antitoxin module